MSLIVGYFDFTGKDPSSQSYGFFSCHVQMWGLDHKKGWVLNNWCFHSMLLDKTLESPLDGKESKPVNPKKKNQSWIFIGSTDAEAPILWPPDATNWLIRKDPNAGKNWRQEEKGMTEDEMFGWHHQLEQVWASSGRSWRTGKAGMLQSMQSRSQTQLSDWITSTLSIKINDVVSVLKKFGS